MSAAADTKYAKAARGVSAAKVLFVDDDPNLIEGLKRALRKQPFEIHSALSAKDGMAVLEANEIDIVVSDNDMPGMAGVEFLARARTTHPETMRVMLTGRASLESAVQAINEGEIFRFLVKPCDSKTLVQVIDQGVRHKRLLTYARQLLQKSKRQASIIDLLEKESPGITRLQTDHDGAIVLDDVDTSLAELLETMQ